MLERSACLERFGVQFAVGSQPLPSIGHQTQVLTGYNQGPWSIGRCGSSRSRDLSVAGFRPWGIARRCRFSTLNIYEIQVISRKDLSP